MTDVRDNLPHILEEHRKWRSGEGGQRADLQGADLRNADFRDADLRYAILRDAILQDAELRGADLRDACLRGACLRGADLRDADLQRADLQGADLRNAILWGAFLRDADLQGADLQRADLQGAQLIDGGQRRDGYRFVGWIKDNALMIRAGCRDMTVAEYRDHNAKREDATMRDETASILDHIERVAKVRGLV
jgi:hypothetical protein